MSAPRLWDFHGASIKLRWDSTESQQCPHGYFALPWDFHGITMYFHVVLTFEFHRTSMVLTWDFRGALMTISWYFCGTSIKAQCFHGDFHGAAVVLPWSLQLPSGFHGASMVRPWCFHGDSMGMYGALAAAEKNPVIVVQHPEKSPLLTERDIDIPGVGLCRVPLDDRDCPLYARSDRLLLVHESYILALPYTTLVYSAVPHAACYKRGSIVWPTIVFLPWRAGS